MDKYKSKESIMNAVMSGAYPSRSEEIAWFGDNVEYCEERFNEIGIQIPE